MSLTIWRISHGSWGEHRRGEDNEYCCVVENMKKCGVVAFSVTSAFLYSLPDIVMFAIIAVIPLP